MSKEECLNGPKHCMTDNADHRKRKMEGNHPVVLSAPTNKRDQLHDPPEPDHLYLPLSPRPHSNIQTIGEGTLSSASPSPKSGLNESIQNHQGSPMMGFYDEDVADVGGIFHEPGMPDAEVAPMGLETTVTPTPTPITPRSSTRIREKENLSRSNPVQTVPTPAVQKKARKRKARTHNASRCDQKFARLTQRMDKLESRLGSLLDHHNIHHAECKLEAEEVQPKE